METYDRPVDEIAEKVKQESGLEMLDHEIGRLESEVERLGNRLHPVLRQWPEKEQADAIPHPVPASELRNRAERLAEIVNVVVRLQRDLDL